MHTHMWRAHRSPRLANFPAAAVRCPLLCKCACVALFLISHRPSATARRLRTHIHTPNHSPQPQPSKNGAAGEAPPALLRPRDRLARGARSVRSSLLACLSLPGVHCRCRCRPPHNPTPCACTDTRTGALRRKGYRRAGDLLVRAPEEEEEGSGDGEAVMPSPEALSTRGASSLVVVGGLGCFDFDSAPPPPSPPLPYPPLNQRPSTNAPNRLPPHGAGRGAPAGGGRPGRRQPRPGPVPADAGHAAVPGEFVVGVIGWVVVSFFPRVYRSRPSLPQPHNPTTPHTRRARPAPR